MRPRAVAALFALLLLTTPLAAAKPSIEDTARTYLSRAVEGTFDPPREKKKDLFERKIKGILRVRCVRIEGLAVRSASDASVEVDLALAKRPLASKGAWTTEIVPLRVHVASQNGQPVVTAVDLLEDELAEQIIAASPEERRALLAANEKKLTGGVARAIYQRAISLFNTPDPSQAPAIADVAIEIAQSSGDRGAEALARGIHAIYARVKRDWPTALRLSAETIEIAEPTGDPDVLGRMWQTRSRIVAIAGAARKDASAALSMEISEALRNALRYAEDAEDAVLLVRVLENLALGSSSQGDFFAARAYHERLLPIARAMGDRFGEIGYEIEVANIYFDQDDRELGLFHHRRALELAKGFDARRYPYILMRLGGALVEEHKYDEARKLFAEALPRDERGAIVLSMNSISPNMAAFVLRHLAIMEAEEGRLDEAECFLEASGAILPKEDGRRFGDVLAPYLLARGDYARTLRLVLPTLQTLQIYAKYDGIVPSLEYAARAYRGLGDLEHALQAANEAIALLEERHTKIAGGEDQRIRSGDLIARVYDLAAGISLDENRPLDALAYLEAGRARVLREHLENGRPNAMSDANELAATGIRRLETQMTQLNRELGDARTANDRRRAASLEAKLTELRLSHQSAVDGARAQAGRVRIAGRHLSDGEFRSALQSLPADMRGVEYFLDERELHIFVVHNDPAGEPRVTVRSRPIDRQALEKNVRDYLELVAKNDLRYRKLASELYAQLIAPVEQDLGRDDVLLIVPDKVLWQVPFASLIDARGAFLVERWAMVHASAIAAYSDMNAREPKPAATPTTLLAVANPTLDTTSSSEFRGYYRDASLGALPEAEAEVEGVRRVYGRQRSTILKRAQATESRVKSEIGEAKIIHFATHALLDDRNPMYSRLALARDGGGADDGWLETWEVARLDIDADLVVLSACETARGGVGDGEGVIGMTWSFFVAGARSTVATGWKVESESAAELMIDFHQSLRERSKDASLRKARALRDAQLRLLKTSQHRHPFYWAGYALFGSGD